MIWLQNPQYFGQGEEPLSQPFNVHGVIDVKQTEIHTAEPLVPELSDFEFMMAIEKLKRHKSPATYQFPVELIKAGGCTVCSEIHKLINSILNKEELPEEWKESIAVPIYKNGVKRECNIYEGFCQPCTKFFPTSCSQG
jgi:hypothetical protein